MTEDNLLEHVLHLAGQEGYEAAYQYLWQAQKQLPDGGSPQAKGGLAGNAALAGGKRTQLSR